MVSEVVFAAKDEQDMTVRGLELYIKGDDGQDI